MTSDTDQTDGRRSFLRKFALGGALLGVGSTTLLPQIIRPAVAASPQIVERPGLEYPRIRWIFNQNVLSAGISESINPGNDWGNMSLFGFLSLYNYNNGSVTLQVSYDTENLGQPYTQTILDKLNAVNQYSFQANFHLIPFPKDPITVTTSISGDLTYDLNFWLLEISDHIS